MTDVTQEPTMTAEQEREAVVAWLRGAPFPWMQRRASVWQRLKSAFLILWRGEKAITGLCLLLALKIQRGHHLSRNPDNPQNEG